MPAQGDDPLEPRGAGPGGRPPGTPRCWPGGRPRGPPQPGRIRPATADPPDQAPHWRSVRGGGTPAPATTVPHSGPAPTVARPAPGTSHARGSISPSRPGRAWPARPAGQPRSRSHRPAGRLDSSSSSPAGPLTCVGIIRTPSGCPPQGASIDSVSRCLAASCQTLRSTGFGARRSAMSPPGGSHACTGISNASEFSASSLAYRNARMLPGEPQAPTITRPNNTS